MKITKDRITMTKKEFKRFITLLGAMRGYAEAEMLTRAGCLDGREAERELRVIEKEIKNAEKFEKQCNTLIGE